MISYTVLSETVCVYNNTVHHRVMFDSRADIIYTREQQLSRSLIGIEGGIPRRIQRKKLLFFLMVRINYNLDVI